MISVSGCSRSAHHESFKNFCNHQQSTQQNTTKHYRYTIAHSTTYYVHCSKSNRVLKAIEPAPRSFLQLPPFAKFYASSRRKVTDWLLCSNYYVLCTYKLYFSGHSTENEATTTSMRARFNIPPPPLSCHRRAAAPPPRRRRAAAAEVLCEGGNG